MPPRTTDTPRADTARPEPVVEPLLTVAEVAATLRIDAYTVRRWIGRGHLAAVRVGRELRVEPATLRAYIANGSTR